MADGAHDILLRAIARNEAIILSLPAADGTLTHHKSRFLSGAPTGFWVELPPGEVAGAGALIASGQGVGVSFKSGEDKLHFTTAPRRHDAHRINATTRVAAIRLDFPTAIRSSAAEAAAARLAAAQARREPALPGWISRMRGN